MRSKVGIVCMVLGALLIAGAMALFVHNQQEATQAEEASTVLLPQIVERIEQLPPATETIPVDLGVPLEFLEPEAFEMAELEIDGHAYIGYLSIPALELELPVMADWSYPKLRIAPCRYTGSIRGEDLVIMAHNYARHFGKLSELSEGDSVVFTDAEGNATYYEVVGRDVLAPTAVEEMTAGDFDLTLFTCTYGGKSRVTVYCDRAASG